MLSAGYDESTRELELEFQSGHVYRYAEVPAAVYAWLLRIENKGGFVRRMIAGRYPERAMGVERAGPRPGVDVPTPEHSLEDTLRASLDQLVKPPA